MKFRRLSLFALLLLPITASPAVKLSVHYSPAANSFDILDNVSEWWPGFCEPEYRTHWSKRFPLTKSDRALFKQYAVLRKRWYQDPDQAEKNPARNRNGLFATLGSLTADPVAEAFYSSMTLEAAFSKLQTVTSPEDVAFLRQFYAAFSDRLGALLEESAVFTSVAEQVAVKLAAPAISAWFDRVARFYRVEAEIEYQVLYVWWPPIDRTQAAPTGNYLVMRYNPVRHLEAAKTESAVVFHEVVHTLSARQPLEQKQKLTAQFLAACKVPEGKVRTLSLLEEPLAVVFGQALFLKRTDPARYDGSANWYRDPWTNLLAKLIAPTAAEELEAERTITDGFVPRAARHCADLVAAVAQTGRP